MSTFKQMKAKWAQRQPVHEPNFIPERAAIPLNLPMGEANQCFYNATEAVFTHPDRLRYVEGFVIDEFHLTHHAWVIDEVGTHHELTIRQECGCGDIYIGMEFTQAEMLDRNLDLAEGGPDYWMPLLTLQEQYDMLTKAGYDVSLTTSRCVAETDWLIENVKVVDMSSIDMSDPYIGVNLEDGYEYHWWRTEDRHAFKEKEVVAECVEIVGEAAEAGVA